MGKVLGVRELRRALPRPGFGLLLDRAEIESREKLTGLKVMTVNEEFFNGHFPEEPVMPGVLIIEALSQCGGLLVMNMLDKPEDYSTYFLKIDKISFYKKVVPGDTLIFKVEWMAPLRHGISVMKGYVFVGERLAAEAQFTGQIIKHKE